MAVLVLAMPMAFVSEAITWTFPVQTEQAVTGTTTGIAGAQTDDGVRETLREIDAAADPVTTPTTQTITAGSMVGGTFPGSVASQDAVYAQYREAAAAATEATIAYRSITGTNTVNSPKTRTWDGSVWSAEAEQATSGSPIRGVRMAWSPIVLGTRTFVTVSDDGWLDAYVCTPACIATNNIGQVWSIAPGTSQKRFDVAYEQLSGDVLLVYGVLSATTTRDLAYRTYSGGSWSAEQYIDDAGHATDVQYSLVLLASKRGSDQIGLLGGDTTNSDVNAWIWDGSSFGSYTEITASAQNPDQEEGAIAWESSSGDLLAVSAQSGSTSIISREFTTSWSATSTFGCADRDPVHWLSLKANPLSTANDMVLITGDDNPQMSSCYWTGSGWANAHLQIGGSSTSTRTFDFAWEDTGSKGLLVYGASSGQITRKTFTAPDTWGAATNAPMGSNGHPWVQLRTNPFPGAGATKILGAVMETTIDALGAIKWDGTTFTVIGASTFTADAGTPTYESFDLEYRAKKDDQLLIRYDWGAVPAGLSYVLSVKGYRVDEDFNVQVLTPPSTWTTRITINSVTNTLFTTGLTAAEYNAGSSQVRFVDTVPEDATVSDMFLDWVAITTVRVTYSLDVRQNVTGVVSQPGPILVVKGNISAGGENFHVQGWNFTTASWNALLSAPFTATNAYHNLSLAGNYLSGGTVRVRFVDAASQDSTQWALSLDFVAVVITNDKPTLTNGGVSPVSGYVTTSFAFFVRYSDKENNAPGFVNLTLDGTPYVMGENNTADTNYVDGKDYFVVRVIGVRGTFNYFFTTQASSGDPAVVTTGVQQVSVVNRGPSITNGIASDAVHTGRSYARDFNGTDPDIDPLTWSLTTNASWLSIGPANGTVWGTAPATAAIFYVNVLTSDGFGGSAADNYTLTVGNLPPTITNGIGADAAHTGRSYTRDFNATDPESDTLTWSITTNASWLSVGPANGTAWGFAPGTAGVFSVRIGVADGFGGSAADTYTLTVGNRPPTISNPLASDGVHTGRPYARTFLGTDPDNDTLAWSLSTSAPWLSLGGANGTVWGVAPSTPALFFVDLNVTDGFGGSAEDNYTLSVGNLAPAITNPIASDAIHNGRPYVRDFNGTDAEGDTLVWSISTNAPWLALGSANGTVWGIAPGTAGVFYVNISVDDGYGGSDVDNYTLSVGNLAPTIANPIGSMTSFRRASVGADFNATDPENDALTWSLRTNAGPLSLSAITGTLSGLAPNVPSVYWVEITVVDGFGGMDVLNFTLAVVNRPPQVSVSASATAVASDAYRGTFSGTDPDNDTLSWTLTTNATWLAIDPGTGTLLGTASAGVYFVNLTANDGYGGVAYQNITLAVAVAPVPPPPPEPLITEGGLTILALGVSVFAILMFLPIAPKPRRALEQAFLIDSAGTICFRYDAPRAPFDEVRVRSILEAQGRSGIDAILVEPYTLHLVDWSWAKWVLVSRSNDAAWVIKAARRLFATAEKEWHARAPTPPSPPEDSVPEPPPPPPEAGVVTGDPGPPSDT